jgi:hypothetical protein
LPAVFAILFLKEEVRRVGRGIGKIDVLFDFGEAAWPNLGAG